MDPAIIKKQNNFIKTDSVDDICKLSFLDDTSKKVFLPSFILENQFTDELTPSSGP